MQLKKTLILLFVISFGKSYSQVNLTIEQVEALFLKNNLQLLATQYNIDAAEANVIQAKIWEQPNLNFDLHTYDTENKKFFNVGPNGEKAASIEQLIKLGGKRHNEIEYAKSNAELAKLNYEQLLLTLKYQIRENFYSLYFNKLKSDNLSTQIGSIDSMVESFSVQSEKGNIPLVNVVRLQSLSLEIKNEYNEIQQNIFEEEQNLKILINSTSEIQPIVEERTLIPKYTEISKYELDSLKSIALEKNPEYLTFVKTVENSELYLKWQKSLSIPDLSVGLGWDQSGSAFKNQVLLSFGIPIPLWNSNKGNILVADAQIKQNSLLLRQKAIELKNNIENAYKTWFLQKEQLMKLDTNLNQNLQDVYKGTVANFQKHNISLIEFTDFMESYYHSILLLNDLKKQVIISGEKINFFVNETIF